MTESVSRIRRPLAALSNLRLERLQARVPLVALSAESGIPLVTLSEAERDIRQLTPEMERQRSDALARLREAMEANRETA